MGYQKDREEFFDRFGREFPGASIQVARLLLRDASASQRTSEVLSSIEVSERQQARMERLDAARDKRVGARVLAIGGKLEVSGDPRGCPFVILCPSGYRLYVPGRGLPERCFR